MRLTKIGRQLVGVEGLYARSVSVEASGLVFRVRPRWRKPRFGGCTRRAPGYDRRPIRRWRHIPVGETVVWLEYAPRRVRCPHCGVTVEQLPWARHASRFTRGLEELTAHLARSLDFTAITELLGLSWRAVASIVERVVTQRLPTSRL